MPSYDPTGTPVLEARGITKRFRRSRHQQRVLTIHKGQIVGLLGETPGKSTLVKMIYGHTSQTRRSS